jgi:hypothetical protein
MLQKFTYRKTIYTNSSRFYRHDLKLLAKFQIDKNEKWFARKNILACASIWKMTASNMRSGRLVLAIFILVFYSLPPVFSAEPSKLANTKPPITNLVPNEEAAISIALAVLTPIYGKKQVQFEQPFHARLDGDIWEVIGTLPKGWLGGVATVKLSRNDGHIIEITHTM